MNYKLLFILVLLYRSQHFFQLTLHHNVNNYLKGDMFLMLINYISFSVVYTAAKLLSFEAFFQI